MKKVYVFVALMFIIALSVSVVQAKIVLNSMGGQYNLGDKLSQTMSVMTVDNFQGFLRASLFCGDQETLLFYSPISTEMNKEKKFSFEFVASQAGSCYIQATLERGSIVDLTQTQTFEITSEIKIAPSLNKQFFMPEEELKISGRVTMVNAAVFNGAAKIIIDSKEYSTVVSKGFFSEMIILEKNIAPGQHILVMQLNDDKGNSGLSEITFEVGVVKTALIIGTDKESVAPGEIIKISPVVVDQAYNPLDEPVSVKLMRVDSGAFGFQKTVILLNELINTTNQTNDSYGGFVQYRFSLDSSPQDYIIEASGAGFTVQKIIYVPVVEKISYEVVGSVLIIKNIGNVVYQRPIELSFTMGDIKVDKIINPKIKVNGQLEYPLNELETPRGEYDLSLKSENSSEVISQVPLGIVGQISGQASGSLNLESSNKSFFIPAIILVILVLLVVLIAIERKFFFGMFKTKKKKREAPATVRGYEVYHEDVSNTKASAPVSNAKPVSSSKSSAPARGSYGQSFSSPKTFKNNESPVRNTQNNAVTSKMTEIPKTSLRMSEITKQHQKSRIEASTSQDKRIFSSRIDVIKALFDKYAQGLSASKIEPKNIAGQKKEVSVLMIRVNGMNDLIALKNKDSFLFNELADTYFSKVLKRIQANGGVADLYDNQFIIFFNVNPQGNHQAMALKTAQEIKKVTQELNQELAVRGQTFQISVSSGLHAGPLVVSSIGMDRSLKYTPVADTTNIAKALERKAFKGEIIMSEQFYNQVSSVTSAKKITPLSMGNKAMNAFLVQEPVVEKKNTPYWAK
jgi:class 3 adenylate cyclase